MRGHLAGVIIEEKMNTKKRESIIVQDKWEKVALEREKTLKNDKLISHEKLWGK